MNEEKKTFRLQGLSCVDCAAKFEKNISQIPTVKEVALNFGAAKVTVTGDVTREQIEAAGAFDHIGVFSENDTHESIPMWKKRENILALISLIFIIIGYSFHFMIGEKATPTIGAFILAILIGGLPLFKEGLKNLSRANFTIQALMTIAIIGAAIIGEWAEGAVVVFLFALSEALESYSVDKARDSIRSLIDIAPTKALIKKANREIEVSVEDVQVGDILLIKPGQKIALDGEVMSGVSSINEAPITGESIPVLKEENDIVFAGTLNGEGFLEVQVTKKSTDTTIAKIIHLVEEAQAEKAPSEKFVDRFAKYYTPIIIVISLLTAIIPPLFFQANWSDWIYSGLAVLVVGCPCALVISTPVAIVTAIGNAARHGVLIKGGVHLEQMGHLKAIAFDKTGTLTKGNPEVTDYKGFGSFTGAQVLEIARAIEEQSEHPLAKAIIAKATEENTQRKTATNFTSITGKGASAIVNDKTYFIGNLRLFENHSSVAVDIQEEYNKLQDEGKTVMLLGTTKEILGLIAVRDEIRDSSLNVIPLLQKLGINHTYMLTGDHEKTGRAIGKEVGIQHVQASLLPDDKLTTIQQLKEKYGEIAMVGDGINDAPALASASVGIAMGGAGSDTALETADVAFMADDLGKLPYTIRLSRKTLRIIKENISFALGLKLIALLLVIPGWLTLWIAIFADLGATLIVVLNSLRLIRTKE